MERTFIAIVIMGALVLLAYYLEYKAQQRKALLLDTLDDPEWAIPDLDRADRRAEAYEAFKRALDRHMLLPAEEQRTWIISWLQAKIAEVEAEMILDLRRIK